MNTITRSIGLVAGLLGLVATISTAVAAGRQCRNPDSGNVQLCIDVCVLQGGEEVFEEDGAVLCCGQEGGCGANCRVCTDMSPVRVVQQSPVYVPPPTLGRPRAALR